jgi:hypothetical protein
LKYVFT